MEGRHLHGDEWGPSYWKVKTKAESGMHVAMFFSREAAQKANSSAHKCVFPLRSPLVCMLKNTSEWFWGSFFLHRPIEREFVILTQMTQLAEGVQWWKAVQRFDRFLLKWRPRGTCCWRQGWKWKLVTCRTLYTEKLNLQGRQAVRVKFIFWHDVAWNLSKSGNCVWLPRAAAAWCPPPPRPPACLAKAFHFRLTSSGTSWGGSSCILSFWGESVESSSL